MLEKIREERLNKKRAYPARVKRTYTAAEVLKSFNALKKVAIVGRIMALRKQGGIIFLDVQDASGRIQILFKKDSLKNFKELRDNLDIGDFVEVEGKPMKTKAGEKSIQAFKARMIVKSLLPLPSQWYGLKDVEERYRKRYLDLLLNADVRKIFEKRSQIIAELRERLIKEGFMEVETPLLQPLPGGATARPFITHHNALDVDFYLRVAPELYLKRLLVGGFEKIFELGRNFRNEGMDRDHNPEFTMLELYWAYQDYKSLMKFAEKLLKKYIKGKWQKIAFADIFKKYANKDWKNLDAAEIDDLYKHKVRPNVKNPTLIIDYPTAIMPLAKYHENEPRLTESFQLLVNGMEIVKGFSEMNDPIEQRKQMEEQERKRKRGDEEAQRLDEDFLEALEYGMPPAAGMGIGIDRLVVIATGAHAVKDVILFPTMRPKK